MTTAKEGRPRRFREQIWERRSAIFRHPNFWVAVALGALYLLLSSFRSRFAPLERPTVEALANGVFALAGFGFSVALAAVAIVVALPGSRLLRNMLEQPKSEGSSAYADLIFLFTWTAIVQGIAGGMGIAGLVFAGKAELLTMDDLRGLVFGSVLVTTSSYALLQLMTAVVAISQVAQLQATYQLAEGRKEAASDRRERSIDPSPRAETLADE